VKELTIDELMKKIWEIMPDAIFDVQYRTGEIMISTGLVADRDGKLRRIEDVLGED